MSPPRERVPPRERLQSLGKPQWLKDIVAAFPDMPAVIQFHTKVWLDEVSRKRSERLARLSEKTASTRTAIVANALDHRGRIEWAKYVEREFEGPEGTDSYDRGDYKCNLFVYEMLALAGARVPLIAWENRLNVDHLRPPLAREWADPIHEIPGFMVLNVPPDVPQPGDVAAKANDSWGATGHVGIVANSPEGAPVWTVSGRSDGVVHNDWGFRDEDQGKVVFRRYVGAAQ